MKNDPGNLKLWKKYKAEKNPEVLHELKNQLVELYYPLVQKISYKVAVRLGWNITPEELASFGVDGLYIAIDRFDLSRGIKFESYANIRIQGSMLDGVRKEDPIPRSVRINNNCFEMTKTKLESENDRKITDLEIIGELGIDAQEYFKNTKKYIPVGVCSLDNNSFNTDTQNDNYMKKDHNSALIDDSNTPDSILRRKEFFNKLLSTNFNIMEKRIIYLYYWENMTMGDISIKLKISESRISQVHKLLLPRLKEKIIRNPEYFGKDIYEFITSCKNRDSLC